MTPPDDQSNHIAQALEWLADEIHKLDIPQAKRDVLIEVARDTMRRADMLTDILDPTNPDSVMRPLFPDAYPTERYAECGPNVIPLKRAG